MDKANKKIIYEGVIIHNAFNNELNGMSNDRLYTRYHDQNAGFYKYFSSKINQIIGWTGQTIDEFVDYVSTINLTPEQKRALVELRKEPMFKRLMGETALQQKSELESVLGTEITSAGMTFADENGPKVAVKTEEQLDQEAEIYSDKLASLLSTGVITEEKYDSYNRNLDYIYDYFISQSKGEQVPFRKMTDAQYENIETKASENGLDFSEQLRQETSLLQDEHAELQELQGSHSVRR